MTAMTLISGIIGIGMMLAFLGFMLWWVPAVPLIIIVGEVALFLIYDFVRSLIYGEIASPDLSATARASVLMIYGACNLAFGLLLTWLLYEGALATAGSEHLLITGVILLGIGTFVYGLWSSISSRKWSAADRRN